MLLYKRAGGWLAPTRRTKIKSNYLNNRDILKEIHASKITYCSFDQPEHAHYDIILSSLDQINAAVIEQAKQNRADRLAREAYDAAQSSGIKVKIDEFAVDPATIPDTDLVFRITTWEHVPLAPTKAAVIEEDDEPLTEYDIDVVEPIKAPAKYVKVNFPPFFHYKLGAGGKTYIVGKSHWKGGLNDGQFSKDHGKFTNKLALMFMKLCERYATRSNWRGYCVDTATEALTQAGWKNIDTISESDRILSFNGSQMAWSDIKSVYRADFDGAMHRITSRGMDALITPHHKLVTERGLVPAELILESDGVVLMGDAVSSPESDTYKDELVELAGWVVTEGCYDSSGGELRRIDIYQNPGEKADNIRRCLTALDYKFSESLRDGRCITFSIHRADSQKIAQLLPNKNLTMEFILALTQHQRELLIETMIRGDGWHRANGGRSWTQKSPERTDMFQALCAIAGVKTNSHKITGHPSFGKTSDFFVTHLFSQRGNRTRGSSLNYHGGKRNGRKHVGLGKVTHPNQPTTHYQGRVWCPETEYGSFVARRAGKVYLTGNTYNDEMRSQALLQLSQIGLQFDESKSSNPFAYYTAAITNSFTRVLNIEKRNQGIRDDILEMNNFNPSYTRQNDWHNDHD
jgi:hypothetical protein